MEPRRNKKNQKERIKLVFKWEGKDQHSLPAHPPSIQLTGVLLLHFFLIILFLSPLCPGLFSGERQALSPPDTTSMDQCWPSLLHRSNTHTNCRHGLKTPAFSGVNPCPSICLRLYLSVSPIAIHGFLYLSVSIYDWPSVCLILLSLFFSIHLDTSQSGYPACLNLSLFNSFSCCLLFWFQCILFSTFILFVIFFILLYFEYILTEVQ